MIHIHAPSRSVRALALVLVAVTAQVAVAKVHAKGLTKGQPNDSPLIDDDLMQSSVRTQPALLQVRALEAQTASRGAGVLVAVLDGGFDLRHEMLAGRLVPGWDALDGDADAQDLGNGLNDDGEQTPDDLVGHGTAVAGLVLAVAPDATILPIRCLDDEGMGTEDAAAAAVRYAISRGADVVNMSFVIPDGSNVLRSALRDAADAGITVIGAAGNDPNVWRDDPSLANRVLAVGAVNAADVICTWSVSGALVDAYAPGENVIVPLGGAIPDSYGFWSGTSFASSFGSGGAALLLSRTPTMTPSEVVTRLRTTTDFVLGATNGGRLHLRRAVLGL